MVNLFWHDAKQIWLFVREKVNDTYFLMDRDTVSISVCSPHGLTVCGQRQSSRVKSFNADMLKKIILCMLD